jgi:hypothetical protein
LSQGGTAQVSKRQRQQCRELIDVIFRNLIPHLSLEEVLYYHKGYLNVPNLKAIQQTIEERQLYYAQEDNQ